MSRPNGVHTLNGHPADPTAEQLQIVDDEKNFSPNLGNQIQRWGLRDSGFAYNIVAVFGSQSTGKSTLLNRLFGTTFDVMDEARRQQTTKGIWMCRGKGTNIMVMDVEGTDSRERGEDQDFERKAALFSLASSEVLIINMWEHQVGLYQGANIGLLKTVFEVNLGLFGKRSQNGANSTRTLLLFVLRDHFTTPLPNLQTTLTADLSKIWNSLAKPPDLQHAQLADYFDLSFAALPHKLLMAEKFEEEVSILRERFVDPKHQAYVFKPIYHKRIPADGVAFYMKGIWDQVQNNKDLDLPTQQELLAQFRCDEISALALSEFNEQARSQKRPIEGGYVVQELGKLMRAWRTVALTRYDRDASRYHPGVCKRKRADLLVSLNAVLSPLFLGQLKNLHKSCLVEFRKALSDGITGEGYNFADVLKRARVKCEGRFEDCAKEAVVAEGETEEGLSLWVWEEELTLLKEDLASVAELFRKDETKKMINLVERNFKKQISEPVDMYLNKGEPHMWDDVLKVFRSTLEKAESTFLAKAKSLDCTDDENKRFITILRKRAWLTLHSKISELTADSAILVKLRTHFEERFRYDEQGVPRVWKPEDDIDGAFKKAKDQTLGLMPLYAKISPVDPSLAYTCSWEPSDEAGDDNFDFEESLIIFTETKSHELGAKFRRDADAYYVEAKRSTVASIAQIPYWMYGVLIVLGWNEAMVVLFNPLYFALLLTALASAYVIVQLGLVGPLFQLLTTISNEIQRQAANRLREHFSQPMLAEPVRRRHNSSDHEDNEDVRMGTM